MQQKESGHRGARAKPRADQKLGRKITKIPKSNRETWPDPSQEAKVLTKQRESKRSKFYQLVLTRA